jgi:tetratricopeptide (TPR) repeat protein
MPSREDIERFTQVLNSLGSEPEIRAQKGESIEEVQPSEGLPSDIGDLLGTPGAPEETTAAAEPPVIPEETAGLDFNSLFGDESAPGVEESPAPEKSSTAEPLIEPETPSVSGPDVDALEIIPGDFGPLDELLTPPDQPSGAEPGPSSEPALPPEFDMPAPEPGPSPEPALPSEFEMPSPEPALPSEFEMPAPEPGPSPEPALPSEFEIPSVDDFLPPDTGGAGMPAMEPPAFEMPEGAGFEPGGAEPPPSGAPESAPFSVSEGIELPSFEEMELTGEPILPEPSRKETAPAETPEGIDLSLPEDFEFGETGQAAPPSETEGGAPEMESLAEDRGAEELGLDEFTLPESVEEFGLQKPAPAARATAPVKEAHRAPSEKRETIEELGTPEVEIELSDGQFARLKKSLEILPRNLKIAVQDIIADSATSSANLKALIDLLVKGAPPTQIAELAGKISGKRIRLPASVEKMTGMAFEAERRTFYFALRENIWPVFRAFFLTLGGLALFLFLGYRFAYLPMRAFLSYRAGYNHLLDGRFEPANESFGRASDDWPMKSWYYRYAEGFASKDQYPLAFTKYEQLLERWPGDRKGRIDYARMKTLRFYFSDAEKILQPLLDLNMYDFDALLAQGDNYLEWAATDPGRFEDARLAYASLMDKYGERDTLLFRMLRYFIRADKNGDKLKEVELLRQYFEERKNIRVDPWIYAELGGYLIDRGELDYAQNILFRALEVKYDFPDAYYQLARYYLILQDSAMEKKALLDTLEFVKVTDVLTFQRITMEIDVHTRLGRAYSRDKRFPEAEREYEKAISLVEAYQKRKLIGTGRIFGYPYHYSGDLDYYESGDLNRAYLNYRKAIENGDISPEIDYKIGYILYVQKDYKAALDSFLACAEAQAPARIPPNLLFATGNAFYQRDDHFAAQGYYMRLADFLGDKRAGFSNFQPTEQPEHRFLVENLWKTNNNLGVVTFRISEKMGDRRKRSEALVYLTAAAEEYDVLSRNPEDLTRPESRNLPSLNMRGILYPGAQFEPQIFYQIPKDLEASVF